MTPGMAAGRRQRGRRRGDGGGRVAVTADAKRLRLLRALLEHGGEPGVLPGLLALAAIERGEGLLSGSGRGDTAQSDGQSDS